MKKIVLAVSAVLALASPALAQSFDPSVGSGNIAAPAASGSYQSAEGAFAQVVPGTPRRAPRAVFRAPNVVQDEHGRVVGADPDPNIRLQLYRDADSIQGF